MKGSFFSLFITEDTIKAFAKPLASQFSQIVEERGPDLIRPILREELDKVVNTNTADALSHIGFDEDAARDLTLKIYETVILDKILRIVRYIKFSEKIYLIARGTTALIAKDFELQLQLLGYNAYVISDAVILKMSKKIFKKNNLVIIFTMKNSTPELEITARNAKEAGATVVTCCCIKGTSLEQHSDITICVGKKNNKIIEEYNISSRLPLQIISKTLTEYLIL